MFYATCSLQHNSALSDLQFAANSELQTKSLNELLTELEVAQNTNNSECKLICFTNNSECKLICFKHG